MKVNCGLSNKVIADLVGNDFSRVVGVGVEGGGLTGNYLKEKTEKNLNKNTFISIFYLFSAFIGINLGEYLREKYMSL